MNLIIDRGQLSSSHIHGNYSILSDLSENMIYDELSWVHAYFNEYGELI